MKSRDDGGSPIADRTVSSGHDGTNNDNIDDNECCFYLSVLIHAL